MDLSDHYENSRENYLAAWGLDADLEHELPHASEAPPSIIRFHKAEMDQYGENAYYPKGDSGKSLHS